jgi:hypothetical protein
VFVPRNLDRQLPGLLRRQNRGPAAPSSQGEKRFFQPMFMNKISLEVQL